jgi:hypothetical protein
MTGREPEDDELARLLRAWKDPEPAPHLEARAVETWRTERAASRPSWRRVLKTSVRVPVPLLAALVLIWLVSVGLNLRAAPARPSAGTADRNAGLLGFEPLPAPRLLVRTKEVQR